MNYQNKFGMAFRQVRRARGLTQEDFAHESGRTYISELERGVKQPTLQKVDELAGPLGVHPLTALVMAYLDTYDAPAADKLLGKVRRELGPLLQSNPSQ